MATTSYPVIQLADSIQIRNPVFANEIIVLEASDNPIEKKVKVNIKIGNQDSFTHDFFVVWEGEAYDAIGNWTDQDLITALTNMVYQKYNPV